MRAHHSPMQDIPMQLDEVKALLKSENPKERMSAVTALRQHEETVAVPLLIGQLNDPEFIIRSFATIALGHKRTSEGFAVLLNVLQYDRDANVRSEAANSLSRYGKQALPYLLRMSETDDHWLVYLSLLPVVAEFNCPEELYSLCLRALDHRDPVVQCAGLEYLAYLEGTIRHEDAQEYLLIWSESENWILRKQTVLSLRQFKGIFAQNALTRLRQDPDYRVIAATFEGLI
jgi:HEAT repeat protein